MVSRLDELKKKWMKKGSTSNDDKSSSAQQTATPIRQPETQRPVTPADPPAKRLRPAPAASMPLKAGIPLGRGRGSLKQILPETQQLSAPTGSQPVAPADRPFTVAEIVKEHQDWLKANCGSDSISYSSRASYKFNKKDFKEVSDFIEGLKITSPELFA